MPCLLPLHECNGCQLLPSAERRLLRSNELGKLRTDVACRRLQVFCVGLWALDDYW